MTRLRESGGGYRPVGKDEVAALGTGPVSARPYHDPAWFELEREAIFRRTWLHVGRENEVAARGRFIVRPIEIARASILIVRGMDGELRAFHNVCSHRGTRLVSRESGEAASFSCRYHAWTYATDGTLRGVPDEQNFFDLDKARCGLRRVALESCGGFLFVNLDPAPKQTLRDFLGPWARRLEELRLGPESVFSEYVYEVAANWKTTYNNFQEIYHGRFVHARSIGASAQTADNPFGYPTSYAFDEAGLHSGKSLWFNPEYKPGVVEAAAGRIQAKQVTAGTPAPAAPPSVDHIYLFPNTTVLAVGNGGFTQTIWPLTAGRTRGVVRQYWAGAARSAGERFLREYRLAALLDVHSEDRDIIEDAQAGIDSGVLEHFHFQVHEAALRQTSNAVERCVRDYERERAAGGEG
ncbi:MAG: aromatic ring-hydroxylating dioxygenase subunit alpha [Gammaproteobacteria bacterium]